jgi:hypothetical protein
MDGMELDKQKVIKVVAWLVGTGFALAFSVVVFDGFATFILFVLSLTIGVGGVLLTLRGDL